MKNARARVATGVTVVLLGGLTGLALSQGSSAPSKPVADKPIVHTKVIRRTVHVTKHAKPKRPGGAGSTAPGTAAGAGVVTSTSSTGGEAAPVATSSSGGGEVVPVTTASSGSGGAGGELESDGGGEVEHEGGDD